MEIFDKVCMKLKKKKKKKPQENVVPDVKMFTV